jgi:hypothetical protein
VKEFARFLEFTLINNTCWSKESVMSNIHNLIYIYTSLYSRVDESK